MYFNFFKNVEVDDEYEKDKWVIISSLVAVLCLFKYLNSLTCFSEFEAVLKALPTPRAIIPRAFVQM